MGLLTTDIMNHFIIKYGRIAAADVERKKNCFKNLWTRIFKVINDGIWYTSKANTPYFQKNYYKWPIMLWSLLEFTHTHVKTGVGIRAQKKIRAQIKSAITLGKGGGTFYQVWITTCVTRYMWTQQERKGLGIQFIYFTITHIFHSYLQRIKTHWLQQT